MGGGYLKLKDTNKEGELVSAETLKEKSLVGIYIEEDNNYTKVDQIPDTGYTINEEKSYCKIGDELQDMTITYDMNTKTLSIAPMTMKGTKCYLYFDEEPTLKDTILANSKVNEGTPNFANVATKGEGIYKTQDDWGDSYYFRGDVKNNWLKFAGYYWRIIRINGDGSIRVIYNGKSTAMDRNDTVISSSQVFNSNKNQSEYVGYMYTEGEQHGNITNSSIKGVLDSWYSSNLASYADKISTEAGFCGDRNLESGSWSSTGSKLYAAYGRLADNKAPTLKCSNSSDLYTTSSSSKGNKKLTNPIGLITADEVSMAGGVFGSNNNSYYLYNKEDYWTMSPSNFRSNLALVFYVRSYGDLNGTNVNNPIGIRPVINIASNVAIKSGNGTSSEPYEI